MVGKLIEPAPKMAFPAAATDPVQDIRPSVRRSMWMRSTESGARSPGLSFLINMHSSPIHQVSLTQARQRPPDIREDEAPANRLPDRSTWRLPHQESGHKRCSAHERSLFDKSQTRRWRVPAWTALEHLGCVVADSVGHCGADDRGRKIHRFVNVCVFLECGRGFIARHDAASNKLLGGADCKKSHQVHHGLY